MATFEDDAQQVFDSAQTIWPGRVHRTLAAAQAAAAAERAALETYEARRHPGDRLRALGPLEGTPEEIARATPVRWRVYDALRRDQDALDRALAGATLGAEDRALALHVRYHLQRKQDRIACRVVAAWWTQHDAAATEALIKAL